MPLATEQLDDYSLSAVQRVVSRFPAWESLAVVRKPDGYEQAFVDFAIPCPSSSVQCGLWVSTADGEITVGFHMYHSHFTDYQHDDFDPVHVDDALEYAAGILCERLAVLTWYSGEAWAGSATADPSDPFPPKSDFASNATRVTLRSWNGTYDTESNIVRSSAPASHSGLSRRLGSRPPSIMSAFKRGQFVEHDGLLAVIVGTPEDGGAPEDHLALWYGEPQGRRISDGGSGGQRPEVWTVPAEFCTSAQSPRIQH